MIFGYWGKNTIVSYAEIRFIKYITQKVSIFILYIYIAYSGIAICPVSRSDRESKANVLLFFFQKTSYIFSHQQYTVHYKFL